MSRKGGHSSRGHSSRTYWQMSVCPRARQSEKAAGAVCRLRPRRNEQCCQSYSDAKPVQCQQSLAASPWTWTGSSLRPTQLDFPLALESLRESSSKVSEASRHSRISSWDACLTRRRSSRASGAAAFGRRLSRLPREAHARQPSMEPRDSPALGFAQLLQSWTVRYFSSNWKIGSFGSQFSSSDGSWGKKSR